MWDRNLARVRAGKYRTELASVGERPINSAPYQTGLRTRDFKKHNIDKMLAMVGVELAQTERAASTVFMLKKYRTVHFGMDYSKLNARTILDSYPIQWMD